MVKEWDTNEITCRSMSIIKDCLEKVLLLEYLGNNLSVHPGHCTQLVFTIEHNFSSQTNYEISYEINALFRIVCA